MGGRLENVLRVETLSENRASDGADMTWYGRSFHVQAPETGKARLPTVETTETRTGGTARRPQPLS